MRVLTPVLHQIQSPVTIDVHPLVIPASAVPHVIIGDSRTPRSRRPHHAQTALRQTRHRRRSRNRRRPRHRIGILVVQRHPEAGIRPLTVAEGVARAHPHLKNHTGFVVDGAIRSHTRQTRDRRRRRRAHMVNVQPVLRPPLAINHLITRNSRTPRSRRRPRHTQTARRQTRHRRRRRSLRRPRRQRARSGRDGRLRPRSGAAAVAGPHVHPVLDAGLQTRDGHRRAGPDMAGVGPVSSHMVLVALLVIAVARGRAIAHVIPRDAGVHRVAPGHRHLPVTAAGLQICGARRAHLDVEAHLLGDRDAVSHLIAVLTTLLRDVRRPAERPRRSVKSQPRRRRRNQRISEGSRPAADHLRQRQPGDLPAHDIALIRNRRAQHHRRRRNNRYLVVLVDIGVVAVVVYGESRIGPTPYR